MNAQHLLHLLAALPGQITEDSIPRIAGNGAKQAAETVAPGSGASLFELGMRMTLALAIVLGLIAAAVWVMRRQATMNLASKFGGAGAANRIEILSSRSLGPRRSVVLARVRGRAILIGATPSQITLLTEWDEEDTDEDPARSSAEQTILSQAEFVQDDVRIRRRAAEPVSKAAAIDAFHALAAGGTIQGGSSS